MPGRWMSKFRISVKLKQLIFLTCANSGVCRRRFAERCTAVLHMLDA